MRTLCTTRSASWSPSRPSTGEESQRPTSCSGCRETWTTRAEVTTPLGSSPPLGLSKWRNKLLPPHQKTLFHWSLLSQMLWATFPLLATRVSGLCREMRIGTLMTGRRTPSLQRGGRWPPWRSSRPCRVAPLVSSDGVGVGGGVTE